MTDVCVGEGAVVAGGDADTVGGGGVRESMVQFSVFFSFGI